ncbi:LOW QUALITY PROTEIN: plexin-B3 [Myotis lucifugus]|uniref:LOW QUALITY PROTEIN: plexin-B3 n=1 Tax=Myotis lucifugus TaxID=59463 RepID=UPI0003C4B48D|nr:LOW QUALITY PROTEIN: plexin-B3 [Myotis lucifugus]
MCFPLMLPFSTAPVMAPWSPFGPHLLLVLLLLCPPLPPTQAHRFSALNTTFNHLALAPDRGTVYVGAVNRLFQLSPELQLEAVAITGPIFDSPDCVPFRDPAECPQAQLTDNANQLLLVSSRAQELVACGQVRQGVCEKRRLEDVSQLLYQAEDPGDGQFVAANAPGVATVGLVVPAPGRDLLLVARGLAGKLSGGVPPLTVRQLAGPQPFSSEGLGRLVVGDLSDYNNSYVAAFANARSAYFVFRRRGARAQADYRSYVARVCLGDANLYSYVEVPLHCHGQGLIQAAFLAPGTLLGAFAAGPKGTQAALCAFPLAELDGSMEQARRLCYTAGGRGPSGTEEATVEYGVTSRCVTLPPDSPESYPCGDEHTPSPIAGRQPLEARPLLQLGQPISAIAALQADGHMVAFLGDTQGQLHKVFLNGSQSQVYHSQQVGPPGSAISPDLLVDNSSSHLYVLTAQQVDRVPVAACPQLPDCTSCLQARDPLCGWCILQGRCTRKGECARAAQPNQWLWSYEEDSRCLHVQSLLPAHHPRQEQGQVTLSVPRLPTLAMDEYFHCAFGDYDSLAQVEGPHVACVTPPQDQLPLNPPGTDHITLSLALMFEDVAIAVTNFSFYDCSAVHALEVAAPCRACVSSLWRCHWCPQSSRCVYGEHCPEGERTIYSTQEVDVQMRGPGVCPQVEGLASPLLVPVGWESRLALRVRNLQHFRGLPASYHCWLELPGELRRLPASLEETTGDAGLVYCQAQQFHPPMAQRELPVPIYVTRGEGQRLDNAQPLHVTLYDCAVGHPDCSHCQAANGSLGCLWCSHGQPACLYGPLCPPGAVELLCPTPTIDMIEPLTGPPEGGLALTILGSNLGRDFADVQDAVSVAGQPCNPDPALYRTSARIVCVTSPAPKGTTGPIQVAIKSRPPGISTQHFTYQDPILLSLSPQRGPQAGGTQLTIHGQHLQTGGNISAFVGSQSCPIQEPVCPEAIVCHTMPQAGPGEAVVRVVFGQAQRTLGASPFRYTANPQLTAAEPSVSFRGGGRLIRVRGQDLDVVRRPLLSVWLESAAEAQAMATQPQDLRRGCGAPAEPPQACVQLEGGLLQCSTVCSINSSSLLLCRSPAVPDDARLQRVFFSLHNVRVDFANASGGQDFLYQPNPRLAPLSRKGPARLKPGNVLDVEGRRPTQRVTGGKALRCLRCRLSPGTWPCSTVSNPRPAPRRTETMVEKLLTNWLSICLYSFLREVAGEPLYMLLRAIQYQVDKGPVDAVTGKAKRTLNDSRLLREDMDFRPLTLMVLVGPGAGGASGSSSAQHVPARVLDTDTITQVKEKVLEQVYKGTPFSQRPSVHTLDLEWRSGLAGHLTLSDEDLTSVTQNHWKRLNTLQHYKVPDGATVRLIPQLHNGGAVSQSLAQSCSSGENTPMLEDGEEGGVRLWHLVKGTEEPDGNKVRRSSLRERERERARAKAIPEIYLTRLLSMKGTLQKFVDDTFQAILSVNRPVPIAVKYLFDFLDELAEKHGIEDPETLHIWKTNSLLLRFWVNTLKNPQLIFDVRVSDNVDAILAVIAQTFIDSCTVSEHKVGRDSPVNKLLYAREIPRYKQMVERYYSDIRQSSPASYQEMNSALAELSGNYTSAPHCLEALQNLYHIHRYYEQIINALEGDPVGQKMQLACRLQQIAALVENKVTDL